MDIMLVSCNSRIVDSDGKVIFGLDNDNCVKDQAEVEKYLSNKINVIFYYNQEKFEQKKYGDERIKKTSVLSKLWTVTKNSVYTQIFVSKGELVDEVSMLQLGEQDQTSFESLKIGPNSPSSHNKWPTKEKPDRAFKYNSFFFELNQAKVVIER